MGCRGLPWAAVGYRGLLWTAVDCSGHSARTVQAWYAGRGGAAELDRAEFHYMHQRWYRSTNVPLRHTCRCTHAHTASDLGHCFAGSITSASDTGGVRGYAPGLCTGVQAQHGGGGRAEAATAGMGAGGLRRGWRGRLSDVVASRTRPRWVFRQ